MPAAQLAEETFDKGSTDVPITFRVKTGHIKKGESVSMHIAPDHLLQIAGIPHADAINAHAVSIKTHSGAGLVGISLLHSQHAGEDAQYVDAVDCHTLADSSTSSADVFHAVHGLSFTDASKVQLVPDESQLESNKVLTQKRFGNQWLGMSEKVATPPG